MTLKQLRSLGLKWQERLRLLDWDVKYRFAKKGECDEAWGLTERDWHSKTATIIMVSPDNPYWGTDDHPRDFETILVHELLHIHMAPFAFEVGSPSHTTEENIVNQVSRLLVALERQDESVCNGGRPLSRRAAIRKPSVVLIRKPALPPIFDDL